MANNRVRYDPGHSSKVTFYVGFPEKAEPGYRLHTAFILCKQQAKILVLL
ncbi:MAG: hypothetical protein HQL72_12355 [Magnetococcales bacterium]|nr:hypothetical protein [Magnetococcales bacterium]